MKKGIYATIFVLVIGALVVVSFFVKINKESRRSNQIELEIESLREEASRIEKDNDFLQRQIEYFNSQEYKEKVGKEKLNLKKKGEDVIVVRSSKSGDVLGDNDEMTRCEGIDCADNSKINNKSNYEKWWSKFFQ